MVILTITIIARSSKRDELLSTCDLIIDKTRQEEGCLGCGLSQSRDDQNFITLEQQWDRQSLLKNYFRSDHFIALLGSMKWLGRSYEIRINEGTHEEGMKLIQSERMK